MSRRLLALASLVHLSATPCALAQLQNAPEIDAVNALGIELPAEIMRRPPVSRQLRALAREKCDRQAIYDLSKALEDESFRRQAAEGLVAFSNNCDGYDEALRRAINLFLDISDYGRSIEVADELIEMQPNNDNGYYLRAVAYERSNRCEQAIADYSSAIELFGNKDKISSVGYQAMSRCYEDLGQFCDAMTPIEAWVALDPAQHDNDQTRAILRRLGSQGECAQETKATKEERFRRRGSDVIRVEARINDVTGTFIVDTGASFVSVKKAFADKAGIKASKGQGVRLKTANGAVDGTLTHAGSVKLRSLESKRVQVVVLHDDEEDFGDGIDGLIGMSFLSRFDIALESRTLRIRPRKTR